MSHAPNDTPPDVVFPNSLWAATAPARPLAPALASDADADTVVIGGGFTGLSAALELALAGQRVVLLEARAVGWGASGRNNGQVIPTMTAAEPDAIVQRWGKTGERFVRLIGGSASLLFDIVRREHIEAEAEQTGWFQPAHSPGRVRCHAPACKPGSASVSRRGCWIVMKPRRSSVPPSGGAAC